MRIFKQTYKDRKGKVRETQKYYLELRDKNGKVRRLSAFSDKRASEELGRNIERLISFQVAGESPDKNLAEWVTGLPEKLVDKLVKWRILGSSYAAASKSIEQHLIEYTQYMKDKNNGQEHIKTVKSRIKAIADKINATVLAKITAEQVQRYLADRRAEGLSAQSSNHYLSQMKAFLNWAVARGYLRENPLRILKPVNVKVDRRRERRALTNNEVSRLLKAAENGGVHYKVPGRERKLVYLLALESGLRASEIKSLTVGCLDLESKPLKITLPAKSSKHRSEDVIPLRENIASLLKEHTAMKLPAARVFPSLPDSKSIAKMLKIDLKAGNVPYQDEGGRYADFHALRHTFITNLARSGVHPRAAQSLARHCDINLTMKTYTHITLDSQLDSLNMLPDFTFKSDNNEDEKAG